MKNNAVEVENGIFIGPNREALEEAKRLNSISIGAIKLLTKIALDDRTPKEYRAEIFKLLQGRNRHD